MGSSTRRRGKKLGTHNRLRTRKHKQSGGLLGAIRDAFNSGDRQHKQGEENTSYTAFVGQSGWIRAAVNHQVEYIVPNNFLALKNPNTVLTPRFMAHIGNGAAEQCFFRIAEPNNSKRIKFVEYFIYLRGNWYCMMRIFGINTGLLATLTNVVFYKLQNSWFSLKNNSIHIPADSVVDNRREDLNSLQRLVMRNEGRIVQIIKGIEPITSGEEYKILRQFRNGQIFNASAKEEMAEHAVGEGLEFL